MCLDNLYPVEVGITMLPVVVSLRIEQDALYEISTVSE
jgi:hypothetical protein